MNLLINSFNLLVRFDYNIKEVRKMLKKKLLGVVSLLLLMTILSSCFGFDSIHITGRVVDQHGNYVAGMKIICQGSTDTTDSSGRFNLTIGDVKHPTDVKITFDGSKLGFATSEIPVRITPDTDKNMGNVELKRIKALIHGEVTLTLRAQSLAQPLAKEKVELPTNPGKAYPEGELLVKLRDGIEPQRMGLLSKEMDMQVVEKFSASNIVLVKTAGDLDEAISSLEERTDVEYAEPNYYVYPLDVATPTSLRPNDTYYTNQWNLQAINMELAWEKETGSHEVLVAVLDTGIQRGLPDLDRNIDWELGYDFVDNDDDASTWWNTHGTQVASIIGAIPDNHSGIAGINHDVSIVPIRILNSTSKIGTSGKTSELLLGIEHAINMQVDIINLSVAIDVYGYSDSKAVNELLAEAEAADILVVAAAGNDNDSHPTYPASNSNVLAVGAVGPTLQPASYTNHGVDIYAPGGDYYLYPVSTYNTIRTSVGWAQGTSLASAHVAGVAALMLARNPYLDPDELRDRLKNTSLKLAYEESGNPGLLDAYRAITNTEHGRILVFAGTEDWNEFDYLPQESTYTYNQFINNQWVNYYQISALPAGYHWIYAWIDWDGDERPSPNDSITKKLIYLDEGDLKKVDLNLELY